MNAFLFRRLTPQVLKKVGKRSLNMNLEVVVLVLFNVSKVTEGMKVVGCDFHLFLLHFQYSDYYT